MKTKLLPREGGPALRVISLGGGVQSTALALMAALGSAGPMPDAAIFADTRAESAATYSNLRWLGSANVLPFPLLWIDGGDLAGDLLAARDRTRDQPAASIPYFIDSGTQRGGMAQQRCTYRYKIAPIMIELRRMLGIAKGKNIRPGTVEVWLGISADEAHRMRPAVARWQTNRWPLIELGMSRRHCAAWLLQHHFPVPPRSSCVFCPYHSDAEWHRLRQCDPDGWRSAVAVDTGIRAAREQLGLRGSPFLHRSLRPLTEAIEAGGAPSERDQFAAECQGVCAV